MKTEKRDKTVQEMETPVGRLRLEALDGKLSAISLIATGVNFIHLATDRYEHDWTPGDACALHLDDGRDPDRDVLAKAACQLDEYFKGIRQSFDLPLAPEGTEFQKQVWNALCEVPYGMTWSYRQLAQRIGNPDAVRAVGQANSRNPLMIVVPCHRVIGASGNLVGYAGGLPVKQALLEMERNGGTKA